MKKRKIKINPGDSSRSKIKIKGKNEESEKIRIHNKHSKGDKHDDSQVIPKGLKKGIIFGLAGSIFLGLIILGWWLFKPSAEVPDEASVPLTQITTPELPEQKFTLPTTDTLIQSKEFDQNISFKDWLKEFKVSPEKANQLARKFKNIVGEDTLRAGYAYHLWALKSNPAKVSKMHYEISHYDYLVWGMEDSIYMDLVNRKREIRIKRIHDVIQEDFSVSIDENKIPMEILPDLERAMAWKVDFFHLGPGDAYSLVFEENYSDGAFVRTGTLRAAWIRTKQKEHFSYLFMNAAQPGYFDEEARPVKSSFLRSPLKYSQITSHFGIRTHPIDKTKKQHRGTDYAAREGTEIYAVANGRITAASFNNLNGNFVRIDHGQGYETIYLHLKGFGNGIRKGARVTQNQLIGYVGSTGKSTGPHLCFNLKKKGKFLDYLKADLPMSEPLPPAEANRFRVIRDSLNAYLRPGT